MSWEGVAESSCVVETLEYVPQLLNDLLRRRIA